MNVRTELDKEARQATMTVEVGPERVASALKTAARQLARRVSIPGFRKGKAPYHVVVQHFGEGALYDEALDPLGQEVYREALEKSELEPYAPGNLEDIQLEPMVLTFNVPLRPEVDLRKYRGVRVKPEKVKVTKQEVGDALEAMQAEQAVLEKVERGIEMGDVANFDLQGTFVLEEGEEPETLVERKDAAILIAEGTTYPLPGFADAVLGMKAEEGRSFSLKTPEDFSDNESLNQKDVQFEVKCLEVKQRDLPELDDDFAQSVGEFENLKALREHVEEDIRSHKQLHADEEQAEEAIQEIVEQAEIHFPPIMLEEWIDRMVGDFERALSPQNLTLDDYFSIANTDLESVREEFREDAEKNLRRALVMGKLAEVEHLSVADDEINDEIETMLLSAGQQAALARHFFNSDEAKDDIRNSLLVQKVRERLVALASGKAPPLDKLEREPLEAATVAQEVEES